MADTFNGPLYQARHAITETIPLYVYLVKGDKYAVWIDSGVKAMYPLLAQTMRQADVADDDLRFILHTHSHHDHIGCNAQLQGQTGCLIVAPGHYAAWHSDFERHYQEFARPFPHLVADTPELRDEVLGILDEPRPLDLHVDEGAQFNLGGGVQLTAYSFPGHLLAELGWFEESTRTLILGDAITGLDWPLFHSHLSVAGYRASLDKIGQLLDELKIRQVVFGHYAPMNAGETRALLGKAHAYIDDIEATLIRLLAAESEVILESLWVNLCARMERMQEFRSLNMINAHLNDLIERGIVRETGKETYRLR
jgi:hydroxyacylglutathione hydrolase